MNGLGRIYCFFGRHVRSRGRARRVGEGWHSYCRQCGVEMYKEDGGNWYVVPEIETDEPDYAVDGVILAAEADDRHRADPRPIEALADPAHVGVTPRAVGWRPWRRPSA